MNEDGCILLVLVESAISSLLKFSSPEHLFNNLSPMSNSLKFDMVSESSLAVNFFF